MEEQIGDLLKQLSAALGVAVEVIWVALIRQARVEGIYSAIISGLCLLLAPTMGFMSRFLFKRGKEYEAEQRKLEQYGDAFGYYVGGALCAVAGVGVFFACFFHFWVSLTALNNPEYWAIREVLSLLNK